MSLMSAFPQAEDWAAEFAESTAFSFLPDAVKEGAPAVCVEFLRQVGEAGDADVRRLLLEVLPSLDLAAALRAAVPEILQEFTAWLEDTGRMAGGRSRRSCRIGRWGRLRSIRIRRSWLARLRMICTSGRGIGRI